MLADSFMESFFCLSCTNVCVLDAPISLNYITLLMPWCFVLGMDNFQPQCGGRFKLNRDMMFIEEGSQESIFHCDSFLMPTPICTYFFP